MEGPPGPGHRARVGSSATAAKSPPQADLMPKSVLRPSL